MKRVSLALVSFGKILVGLSPSRSNAVSGLKEATEGKEEKKTLSISALTQHNRASIPTSAKIFSSHNELENND